MMRVIIFCMFVVLPHILLADVGSMKSFSGKTFSSVCDGGISTKIVFLDDKKAKFIYRELWSEDEDNGGELTKSVTIDYKVVGNEIRMERVGIKYSFVYSKYFWTLKGYQAPIEGLYLNDVSKKNDGFFDAEKCQRMMHEEGKVKNYFSENSQKEKRLKILSEMIQKERNRDLQQVLLSISQRKPLLLEKKLKEQPGLANTKSFFHDSPLIFAVKYFNFPEIVNILLKYGASPYERIEIGAYKGETVVDIFINKHLMKDDMEKYKECFDIFVFSGKLSNNSANRKDASESSMIDFFKAGAERIKGTRSNNGENLLFTAIRSKNYEVVEHLLSDKSYLKTINHKNNSGITPLKLAKQNNSKEIVELLKKHGGKE